MEERRTTQIRFAKRELELAVAQETEAGNPVIGAKHYTTAIELVLNAVEGMRHTPESADYFHFQIRQKLEDYYERVKLLLAVAEDEGLDVNLEDCMPFQTMDRSGGPPPLGMMPPALGVPFQPFSPPHPESSLPPMPLGFTHGNPPTPHFGYPAVPEQGFGLPQSKPTPQVSNAQAPTQVTPLLPQHHATAQQPTPQHHDPTVPSDEDLEKAFAALSSTTSTTAAVSAVTAKDLDEIPPVDTADFGAVPITFLIQPNDVEVAPPSSSQESHEELKHSDEGHALATTAGDGEQKVPPNQSSVVRRMFQDDDHLRPGNPSFDELFKKFAEMDSAKHDDDQ